MDFLINKRIETSGILLKLCYYVEFLVVGWLGGKSTTHKLFVCNLTHKTVFVVAIT